MKKSLFILLAVSLVLSGCDFKWPWQPEEPVPAEPIPPVEEPQANESGQPSSLEKQLARQSEVKQFKDLEEFKQFANDHASNSYGMLGGYSRDFVTTGSAPSEDLSMFGDSEQGWGGGGSDDYSATNIQVQGVDEADIVKTDGKYIYALAEKSLHVIEAYPATEAKLLTTIKFRDQPQEVFIQGQYLVVYGVDHSLSQSEITRDWRRSRSYAFVKVFDLSSLPGGDPKEVRDLNLEGSIYNSRLIGDYLYFVTQTSSYQIMPEDPVLPRILEDGAVINNENGSDRYIMPEIYYFGIPYTNYNLTTVAAINVVNNDEPVTSEIYVMDYGQNMYVSPDNIYLTYTKHINEAEVTQVVFKEVMWSKLTPEERERYEEIEGQPDHILNKWEKMQKLSQILELASIRLDEEAEELLFDMIEEAIKMKFQDLSKELEKTVVHKININGSEINYQTSGEVTGHLLNQWSMDESGDYFRIATTKGQTWSQYLDEEESLSYSNLYVLDKDLNVVGSLENLAPDERIYAVRFMQNRAYLVTFKTVDPLFVIDLAEPTNPKVLGELKVPGFSEYLHPYDDTTLIGLGKSAGENVYGSVVVYGLKLSLFDVSDVANPKEIDNYEFGGRGSSSLALNDHKAFLFSRDKNLLVLPVSLRGEAGNKDWGEFNFGGAIVFKVTKEGFSERGRIDHSDGGQEGEQEYWWDYPYYNNMVKRSLYIDDALYTLSGKYLKANNLENLDAIKNINFAERDFEIIRN